MQTLEPTEYTDNGHFIDPHTHTVPLRSRSADRPHLHTPFHCVPGLLTIGTRTSKIWWKKVDFWKDRMMLTVYCHLFEVTTNCLQYSYCQGFENVSMSVRFISSFRTSFSLKACRMSQIRSIIIHNDVHFLIWHIFCLKKVATATYEKKFKSPTKETSIIIDFNEYLMKGIFFNCVF